MPSLSRAKLVAIRASCLSNARSTMASLHIYAGDYGEFPVNIRADRDTHQWEPDWITPDNPIWTAPESGSGYTGHYGNWPVLRLEWGSGLAGVPSNWRGFLVSGKYGSPRTFGCSQPVPDGAWLHDGESNWFETDREDFRKAPSYVYMGPGVDLAHASTYHTAIDVSTRRWRSYRMPSSPLLAECCYGTGWDATDRRFNFHTRKLYYGAGEPSWYARHIDMTIAWTDGHAENHNRPMVPPGFYKLVNYNWNAVPQ
jgi:hypothetical protein